MVFDRPHRLVVNWIYEVPWFGGGWAQNPVMRGVFAGWQLAGVMQTQSGQPFTIVTGVDSNGNGGGGDRPNRGSGTLTPDPVTGNFRTFTNNGAYVTTLGTNGLPIAFSLGNGNVARNELRGPGFVNWDLSLSKRFQIVGSHAISVRADFLNAFNQDEYGNPISNMTNTDFGKNTTTGGTGASRSASPTSSDSRSVSGRGPTGSAFTLSAMVRRRRNGRTCGPSTRDATPSRQAAHGPNRAIIAAGTRATSHGSPPCLDV